MEKRARRPAATPGVPCIAAPTAATTSSSAIAAPSAAELWLRNMAVTAAEAPLSPEQAQAIALEVGDWQARAPGTKLTEHVNRARCSRLDLLDASSGWPPGRARSVFQACARALRKTRSHERSHAKESAARASQPSTPLDHFAQAVALSAGLHETSTKELGEAMAEACGLNPFSVSDWGRRWRRMDKDGG